ncbi:PAS domain S-box protein [Methylomonas sp. SURF-2]|uniref:PAS domain S-box protein n=1 Tax=Methylomonas subterranea TaxID=2952225 RepID=A0ABT1TH10_9GAMM|nr:PAS domain S-box protein [Methylomonas sp. SURF-2]MCQ8104604.1 PAS domain S-box protein [Methylomonas sp. SURF-2]
MNNTLITRLQALNKWQIWLSAVILAVAMTLLIVAGMNFLLEGRLTANYLLTGLVASLAVATAVSGLIIYFLTLLAQIQQDKRHLNAIIAACPIPIALNDDAHNIVLMNPEFSKVFGFSQDDTPTLHAWWSKAYPDADYRQEVVDTWQARLDAMQANGGNFEPLEVRICCKNGTIKTALATATPLEPVYTGLHMVILYDITETARTAAELLQSRNILQSIIETIPMRVFWKDLDSRYLGCNTAFAQDGGESGPLGVIGKLDFDLTWKDQADLYRFDDQQVMRASACKLAYEEPQTTPNGQTIWLRTSKTPLRDNQSNVIGVLGVYEDITDRKQIENELWLAKAILDKSNTAFYRVSSDGTVQYANAYASQSLGYSPEELTGMHPWDFDPNFPASAWPEVWRQLQNQKTLHFETRHRRKDGGLFDVAITGHHIVFNGEEFSFTFAQDISARKRIETALAQKEGYQRALLDNFPFGVWLKDPQSRFLAVNQVFARSFGAPNPDALIGKTDYDIAGKNFADAYRADDAAVMLSRRQKITEEQIVGADGQKWVETFKAPVIEESGTLLGTVGFFRDISERKSVEIQLRIAATAFESQESMVITDHETVILKVNRAFTDLTGYMTEEVVGKKMNILRSGIHDAGFYDDMWSIIAKTGYWQGEIWNRRKNGDTYPEWLTITAVKDNTGRITHYVGSMQDITSRKEIEEEVRHLAHFDVLTDLPNRTLLTDRLHQALAQVRREKAKLALMFLDLDRFKPVNDTLGHGIGDLLLAEVARRLQTCIKRETDTVARLGGDEFVILLSRIDDAREATLVAENVVHTLNQPFIIERHTINISTSLGIALYPSHGIDAKTLLKKADNAMYQAKEAGRSCFRFFQEAEKSSRPARQSDG